MVGDSLRAMDDQHTSGGPGRRVAQARLRAGGVRLRRMQRGVVAALELPAVAALAVLAVWAWRRASIPMRLPEFDNPAIPDTTGRLSGPWAAFAVLAATVAGLFVLDGVRQVVLASRARAPGPRRAPREDEQSAGSAGAGQP